MINLLLCLLAPGADTASDVLDRYTALRRKGPAVDMAYRTGDIKATLIAEPGQRMRLEAKATGLDYLCIITPKGMRELDRVDREYDELPYNRPGSPPSRVSSAGQTFPAWAMISDFRKFFPGPTTFVSQGRKTIGKVTGDAIKGVWEDKAQDSVHTFEAVIDQSGAPLYVLTHGRTPMGGYRMDWTIERFRCVPKLPAKLFTVTFPDGFSPYSLDLINGPLGVGERFPLRGWTAARGGSLDLTRRLPKGGLIAIVSADSEPSRRAAASLNRVKSAGTPVVTLGDAKGIAGTEGFDPSGAIIDALSVPSTPVFFKIDPQGKITAVWLGFDPAKANEFVKEATGN